MIDMHGDIKNLYYYDTKIYTVTNSKSKNNKMFNIYRYKDG